MAQLLEPAHDFQRVGVDVATGEGMLCAGQDDGVKPSFAQYSRPNHLVPASAVTHHFRMHVTHASPAGPWLWRRRWPFRRQERPTRARPAHRPPRQAAARAAAGARRWPAPARSTTTDGIDQAIAAALEAQSHHNGLRRARPRSRRPGALSVHRRPRRLVAGARRAADRRSGGARAPGSDRSRDRPRRDALLRRALPAAADLFESTLDQASCSDRWRAIRCSTGGRRRSIATCAALPAARSGGGLRPAHRAHGNASCAATSVGGGGVLAGRGRVCPRPDRSRVERGDCRLGPGACVAADRGAALRPDLDRLVRECDHPRARPPPAHRRHARSRTGPGGNAEPSGN